MKCSRVVTLYNQWHFLHWLREDRLFEADIEIILVDDASAIALPPDVAAEIERRGLRLITLSRNVGRCGARNAGASAAQGDYLDFVDGDDLPLPFPPDRSWDGADVVCFPFRVHGTGISMADSFVRHPLLADAQAPNGFVDPRPAAVLWRRAAFLELGGFDPQWEMVEDVELLLRARQRPHAFASQPKQSYNQLPRSALTEMSCSGIRIRLYSRLPPDDPQRGPLLEGETRQLWLQSTWELLRGRRDAYLFRSALALLWNLAKARLGLLRR